MSQLPINNQLPIGASSTAAETASLQKKSNSLHQEDFLKLLVAQMAQQDPMNPQDSSEFLGQMAQFSTVEGISDLNKAVNNFGNNMMANQALQASSMVGRTVRLPADLHPLQPQHGLTAAIKVPEGASDTQIAIHDQSGEVIKQLTLGPVEAGYHTIQWQGVGDDGKTYPPGVYQLSVESVINGQHVGIRPYAEANVDSVTLGREGQGVTLNVAGFGAVNLQEIESIA